ncbi:MAG: mechanosensitive ion channel [Campylobacterales bacterium]
MVRVILFGLLALSFLWGAEGNSLPMGLAKFQENPWVKAWNEHAQRRALLREQEELKAKIAHLTQKKGLTPEVLELQRRESQVSTQLAQIGSGRKDPFEELIKEEPLPQRTSVTNPFELIGAYSTIQTLEGLQAKIDRRVMQLDSLIEAIVDDKSRLQEIYQDALAAKDKDHAVSLLAEIKREEELLEALIGVREKLHAVQIKQTAAIGQIRTKLQEQIDEQLSKLTIVSIVIVAIFLLSWLVKLLLKKYVTDNELFYTISKVVNVVNITILIIAIVLVYLQDVSHLVTFLGFASAGIAIAMKDWFMSLLGWLVIMIGGSMRVGDRIKIVKENEEVIGDILDISPTRITLHEEITWLTYTKHKRAGRIIFVPNNYVFTHLVLNYSHAGLKTVWDGIDVTITFDSNHKKAVHLAKEIARRYSKGYMEITRKQFAKLRDRYSLKNTSVDPRVFTFIEPYGVRISVWYLTNSFATLTLKSTISADIIDTFKEQPDIVIAYPTQHIRLEEANSAPLPYERGPTLFNTVEPVE